MALWDNPAMRKRPALFHYTFGPKLPLIERSGRLMPTGFGLALSSREKPILWWSANPQFETTAAKVMSMDAGKTFFRPDLPQLHELIGAYRFQLPASAPCPGLMPWTEIVRVARMDAREITGLVASGVKLGAKPVDWWGTCSPLELSEHLTLECWDGSSWSPVSGGLPAAVEAYDRRGLNIGQTTTSNTPEARGL